MTEYEKRVNARARAICLDDDPVRCADGCKPASDGKCHYWDNARATFAQDEADGYALVPRHATPVMKEAGAQRLGVLDGNYDLAHDVINTAIKAGRVKEGER